jgi:hypothetical protein
MPRDRENYNKWFRAYYKKHKAQYFAKAKNHQAKKRAWFEERFKDILICVTCKEDDRRCLDFHHVNPKTKFKSIAHMVKIFSQDKIEKEVAKCIVLCSNCHRKKHATVA